MASSNSPLLLVLAIASFVSLISPAISQTCSTQNVLSADRTPYENCLDLPVLDSYLHYTYNATNSSLSVAFVATPSRSDGWVAWAINPTARGMIGSQAFLAYNPAAGARPVVNTYNISSYNLTVGRLSFDYWNLRAESMTGNRIVIHTSVKVPEGDESVNQVWQIGGNVTNGRPGVHPFGAGNLASTAVLRLAGSDVPSSSPGAAPGSGPGSAQGPTTGGGSNTPGQAGGPGNAGSMTTSGINLGVLVLLATVFIF